MRWRLLLDRPADAATNMAVDEALFSSAVGGAGGPTVRLYGWSRPSVSIGFRQIFAEACDVEECERLGLGIVRRVSGGRAVLHDHELTYCVTAPAEGLFRGLSVRQVYSWVTDTLRAAFAGIGIAVDPPLPASTARRHDRRSGGSRLHEPCFAVPTGHEITASGKKVVGSAQKWSRRGFLQHGSIVLSLDAELWRRAMGMPPHGELEAVGLEDVAGRPIESSELAEAVQRELGRRFGEPPSERALSPPEERAAEMLARLKYASAAWNVHRQPIEPSIETEIPLQADPGSAVTLTSRGPSAK